MAVVEKPRISRKCVKHVKRHSVFLSPSTLLRHPNWMYFYVL
jgi:hypothetical protein